ncbi:MAG: hypothetical protein ASARMPREDX12_005028 [Alectoria sarmentosa]|nr:MAG: hypothetical protein ASARMPREDX12_005028 [Alectoria sarmentosa]
MEGSDRSGNSGRSEVSSFGLMDFPRGSDGEVQQTFQRATSDVTPDQGQRPQANNPQFDIFEWYPKYQSCQRYFVDHAQQSLQVQAVAAFVNIHLPSQHPSNPISGVPPRPPPGASFSQPAPQLHQSHASVSLIPYLRRLVVTGLDFPGVLHGFFGDDWATGVGPLHEQERRNYLFAAKSGGWASVKRDYDMLPLETVPFMRPLQGPIIAEIEAAEKSWSEWLAMEDWMVGPRAPENMPGGGESSRGRG